MTFTTSPPEIRTFTSLLEYSMQVICETETAKENIINEKINKIILIFKINCVKKLCF